MSDFEVIVAGVEHTSVSTRTAGAELSSELSRLRGDVDGVLCGQWRGAAATAFDRAWGEWYAGAVEVIRALERMADVLADTARAYQWSEDAATSRLHGVTTALPGT